MLFAVSIRTLVSRKLSRGVGLPRRRVGHPGALRVPAMGLARPRCSTDPKELQFLSLVTLRSLCVFWCLMRVFLKYNCFLCRLPSTQADTGNSIIRRINILSGIVTTIAGKAGISGSNVDGVGTSVVFSSPVGIALSGRGNISLIVRYADTRSLTSQHSICSKRFTRQCTSPLHWQTDTVNHNIRMLDVSTGSVSTLAGSKTLLSGLADGIGTKASFLSPQGVSMDATGSFAVVVRGEEGCV